MEKIEQIVSNLQFTQKDMDVFESLAPVMNEHLKEAVEKATEILQKDENAMKVLVADSMDIPQAIDFWTKEVGDMFFAENQSSDYIENLYGFLKRNRKTASILIDRDAEVELGMQIIIVFMSSMYEVLRKYVPVPDEATQTFFKVSIVMLTVFAYAYRQEQDRRQRALMKSLGISEHLLERLVNVEKST